LTVELFETRDVPSTLYVSTFGDNGIERINPAGHVTPFVTSGLGGPVAIRWWTTRSCSTSISRLGTR
jgi:hypothetical protein